MKNIKNSSLLITWPKNDRLSVHLFFSVHYNISKVRNPVGLWLKYENKSCVSTHYIYKLLVIYFFFDQRAIDGWRGADQFKNKNREE